jgi:hypothetical protein
MSQALILFRSSNFDGTSKLVYNIPQGLSLKNKEVALHSFSFYNSFFNISAALGNNVVSIIVPNFTAADTFTSKTYSYTIADGFYSFSDLNNALQQYQIAQKIALYNSSTGKYMYFVQLFPNNVQYSVQIQTSFVPTAAQASTLGFSLISGATYSLNSGTTSAMAQLNFNNAFGKVIGFAGRSYPATTQTTITASYNATPFSFLSSMTPMINPVDSICLRCNIANNICSVPNDLMSVVPINSQFGAICQYTANTLIYVPCAQTTTNRIEIQMCDQNLNQILQRDGEITLVLSIRDSLQTMI